ncbi:MAG: hypothetical protein IJD98_05690 [Oscillospiraceae bacterium]|nr:hypothetical protein [Oscillospiraceae bacterium]
MYIYWEEISRGYMQKIPDNVSWSLCCDLDEFGYECLNLKIGEEVHCIDDACTWAEDYPNIKYLVGDYLSAVVKKVFDHVIKDNPAFINLRCIQDEVMQPFWKEWKEKGYVAD